ncbi:MAG TPA: sugar ABC transporter permease, partial [Phototrophicaceae bacterium]|nr:sugar ABC transporter permease [Phototrophicaceae bacterium]
MSLPLRLNKSLSGMLPAIPKLPRRRWSEQFSAYLFLLPAIILFAVFAWYPIARSIQMSFQDIKLGGETTWVGLDNYQLMLKDPAFEVAWKNSFEFAGWSLLLGYAVPIAIALFIREMRWAKGFFRVVYFLPTVVPASIAIIIWRFIFDPDAGFVNELFQQIGLTQQMWLQNAALAKPVLVLIMTWGAFGSTALIYLASLQDIPIELYEAAELDGANPWQRIRHIALPHLYPIMSMLFVLQV